MTIIGLNDSNRNFEEIKILNENSFKLKNEYTTDNLQVYANNNTRGISANNYPLSGYTSQGLLSVYSYRTKNIKQHKGNTVYTPGQQNVTGNGYNNNVFNYYDDEVLSNINNIRLAERPTNVSALNLRDELNSSFFGVKRLSNELIPFSNTLAKKNIVRNLYKTKEYLNKSFHNQQFSQSIYNYHTFNFFNLLPTQKYLTQSQKDQLNNNTHKSILIYNNSKIDNSNIFFGTNKKLSINFWINPKRTSHPDNLYNPGCILHIPGIVAVYLIADMTALNSMSQPIEFKIGCVFGNDSNKLYNNSTISSSKLESISNLSLNTWHNISIIISPSNAMILVDDFETSFNEVKAQTFQNSSISFAQNYSSIFTIGNRLSDENNIWSSSNSRKLVTSFFNFNTYSNLHLNEFEINTDNDWESNVLPSNLLNINTRIIKKNEAYNTLYALESHALNAEIYGISIFDNDLSAYTLKNYGYGYDKSISNDINLIFYLPCIYLSETVQRKGYINLGLRHNISYQSVVNPYFAHKIYGHELSIEHFVRDIVNLRLPVILGMNGKEYDGLLTSSNNLYNDANQQNQNQYNQMKLSLANDFWVNDKNVSTILNQLACTPLILTDTKLVNQDFQYDNLIYRNNFILPCDNGKSKIDLTNIFSLTKISNLIKNFKDFFYFNSNPHYIKIDALYKDNDQFTYQKPTDFLKNNTLIDYLLNDTRTVFNSSFITNARRNGITTITKNIHNFFIEKSSYLTSGRKNILFLCLPSGYTNITDAQSLNNIFSKTKLIPDQFQHLTCNSIFKNIDKKYTLTGDELIINAFKTITFLNELTSFDDETISIPYYKYFNSHFSLEGDTHETHSVLFDISNLFYSGKIYPDSVELNDVDLNGTGGALSIKLKENRCLMYRADCVGPHATWSHVGHIFHYDGLINILHPGLANFGENNFNIKLNGEHSMFLLEYNIPVEKGGFNISNNKTYKKLKPSNNLSDLDEDQFVYITGVNLHDENLNIVAKAKFAQPIIKRMNDRYNIRLKMDF